MHYRNKKYWLIVFLLLVILAGGGFYLWRHVHHKKNGPTVPTTTTQTGAAQSNTNVPTPANGNPVAGTADNSKDNPSNQPGTPAASNVQPTTPVGNFVSNHQPTLNGSPGPGENSTCTTTPGVTCEIRFTSGTTVKNLSAQTTDASGSTSWSWSITSVGLTQGSWSVSAVASNGSKTAIANDATPLVIQ